MKGEGSSSLEINAGGLVGESSFCVPSGAEDTIAIPGAKLKAFSLEPGPCTKDQEMKGITYSGPGEGRDYIFRWQGFGKKERNLLV
ncbi:hypothetical protein MTR_2g096890 [Medicago truncatula]|uniref:Uncharacterized protein n=1 Tax=Medicago truncatula TaxID=3880 RepID=A0A072VBQ2_MEDTR|nr:hypothetical protein MTR_2g096890 [Medicago truncatula]